MIFVDTSAWFAVVVPTDRNHQLANRFMASVDPTALVTTDYVLDETLTLLQMRGEGTRAREFGRRVLDESISTLIWVQPNWTAFDAFRDKAWSFTDCVSRSVMQRIKVAQAFAFDEHFREFGNVTVVP